MSNKCLIIYSSLTGNTEKVALRIKSTFERNGWKCDIFKVQKTADDILNPPYDPDAYDVLCVGSGLRAHLPYNETLNVLRRYRIGKDPRYVLRNRDETIPYIKEPLPDVPPRTPGKPYLNHKMVFGADSRKGIVFVTYAGLEFGPKEAKPSLYLLALEMEHLNFKCIGKFCCPGKIFNSPGVGTYHGDIRDRPNERDLLKAEMFIEQKLKEMVNKTIL